MEDSPIYAMFVESLDDEHEVAVIQGALAGARQADATLLCVTGGAVGDPEPERAGMNFVFDLVDERNARGVMVLSSAIGSALGPAGLKEWLERFSALPICCLGVQIDGYPHIGVDNHAGMSAGVKHLLDVHQARRIAFICGPADSPEANERRRAYEDALVAAGLEVDDRLVVEGGDYTKEAGVRGVGALLDDRGVTPGGLDAIAVANDFMALGVIAELQHRNVRVPEDLAVVGFDDVDSARLVRPALTTARQPSEQQGREGAELLHTMLKGKAVAETRVLPMSFVARRSCGCDAVDVGMSTRSSIPISRHSVEASFAQRRQIILAEVMRGGRGAFGAAGRGWESRLLDALIDELQGRGGRSLALAIEQHVRRLDREDVDGAVIQDVLSALRRQSLPCVVGEKSLRDRLEASVNDARIVAAHSVAEAIEARMLRRVELLHGFEYRAHRAMFEELSALGSELEKPLAALGIEACAIASLNVPGDVQSDATVLMAFGSGRPRSGEITKLWALPLHPAVQRMARALIMLPLTVNAEPVGAAVVAVSDVDGVLLEHLRSWFTTMVRVVKLRDSARS